MKTILLGFKTKEGNGPATLLAGPDVSIADQAKQIAQIKSSRVYPEGIVRVEHCKIVPLQVGIEITPSTAESAEPKTKSKKSKSSEN